MGAGGSLPSVTPTDPAGPHDSRGPKARSSLCSRPPHLAAPRTAEVTREFSLAEFNPQGQSFILVRQPVYKASKI